MTGSPKDLATGNAELIDAYLDGTASDVEIAELEARLIAEPLLVRELLDLAFVECIATSSLAGDRDRPPEAHADRPRMVAWLAAALVLLALGAILAFLLTRSAPNKNKEARILSFDFESQTTTYPRWDRAKLSECPPGRLGRGCLSGIRMSLRRQQFGMTLGDWKQPFLSYRPSLEMSFFAWAGASTSHSQFPIEVVFYVGDGDSAQAFVFRTELEGATRWHRILVPLAQATGSHDNRSMTPSDQITAIHITLPWSRDDVFIIDDFELIDVTALK